MNYFCYPWSYVEERNGKYLLIWPDLPRWIIVDKELFSFLEQFNLTNKVEEIVNNLSKKFNMPKSEIKKQISKIMPNLIDFGIIYEKVNPKKNFKKEELKIDDISINITTRCNLKCKMCFNKYDIIDKTNEISTDDYHRFLNQVLEFCSDNVMISISGGETLLCPNKTFDVAEYAKKIGFKNVAIVTNGTLITKEIAEEIKKLDIKVQVSLDGATDKEHDFIRGKGAFDKTIKGIKILKQNGIFTITNYLAHKGNYKRLGAYYDLALKLGVDKARFISLKKMGAGKDEKSMDIVPIDELLNFTYNLFKHHPEYHKLTGVELLSAFATQCRLKYKRGWCGTGNSVVLLDADGNIYPCVGHTFPEFNAGNIKDSSFSDIWLNSPILKKIRYEYNVDNNKVCSKCIVKHWCLSCRSEAYQAKKDFSALDIQCENKKKAIIDMFWLLSENPDLGKGSIKLAH